MTTVISYRSLEEYLYDHSACFSRKSTSGVYLHRVICALAEARGGDLDSDASSTFGPDFQTLRADLTRISDLRLACLNSSSNLNSKVISLEWFSRRLDLLQDLYMGLITEIPQNHDLPFGKHLANVLTQRRWTSGGFARSINLHQSQVDGYLSGNLPRGGVELWIQGEKSLRLSPGALTNHPAIARLREPTREELRLKLKGQTSGSVHAKTRKDQIAQRDLPYGICLPPHQWHHSDLRGAYDLIKERGLKHLLPDISSITSTAPLVTGRHGRAGGILRRLGDFFAYLLNTGRAKKGDEMLPFLASTDDVINYAKFHRAICASTHFNKSVRDFLLLVSGLLNPPKGWLVRQHRYAKIGTHLAPPILVPGDWTSHCAAVRRAIERFRKHVRTQNQRAGRSRSRNPTSDLEALEKLEHPIDVWRILLRFLRDRAENELDAVSQMCTWRDFAAIALAIATSLRLDNILMLDFQPSTSPDRAQFHKPDAYVQFLPTGELKVHVAARNFKNNRSPALGKGVDVIFPVTANEFSLTKIMAEYCNVYRPRIVKYLGCDTDALFPVVARRGNNKPGGLKTRWSVKALSTRLKEYTYLAFKDIELVLHGHLIRHVNAAAIIEKRLCPSGRLLNLHSGKTANRNYDRSVPYARNRAAAEILLGVIRPTNYNTIAEMRSAASGQRAPLRSAN